MNFKDKYMLERYEQILVYSKLEMERRWQLARKIMTEQNADALIVLEGSYEGYNYWFTGNREPEAIIIPKEGDITAVITNELNQQKEYQYDRAVQTKKMPGKKKIYPVHPALHFVQNFDSRDLEKSLKGKKNPRLAFIHPEVLRQTMYQNMKAVLGEFTMFDMGIPLDAVRVIKSEEERYLINQTNVMNEKLMAAARQVIREGRSIKEITDEMQYLAMQLGSGGHFVHVFCLNVGPQDKPGIDTMGRLEFPGYRLEHNDKAFMLIETNGPGGYYSALGRYFVMGKASDDLKKHWNMAVKAQQNAGRLMKPGTSVREIFNENYKFITEECGFKTNHQNYLHSLGFQYGEQPYLNAPSETVPLQAGMHYIAHPVIQRAYPDTKEEDGIFALDTYYVTENGGVRANQFPQEIMELD